jgi:stage II sporulation protein R
VFRLIINYLKAGINKNWGSVFKIITLLLVSSLILNFSVPTNFPKIISKYFKPDPQAQAQEVVRFHVKAHSDRPEDQRIKNELAKMLVNVYGPSWGNCENSGELKAMLSRDLGSLEEAAALFLQEKGLEQQVRISLGKRSFPARSYGDQFYPAGEYEALYVTIGDGAGENWWCVLFPPLCFSIFPVETNNKKEINAPHSGADAGKETALPEQQAEAQSGKKCRFWLVEFLKGL